MTTSSDDPLTPDRPLTPDELAPRLSEVFALLGPLYRRAHRKIEEDAPVEGLSVGVRTILELLALHGAPMTVPQMARALAVSRQFTQRMTNDASALDLVESRPNPAHQRSSLIHLTPAGLAAMNAIKTREQSRFREVGGNLTNAEVTACVKVLSHMLELLADVEVTGQAGLNG